MNDSDVACMRKAKPGEIIKRGTALFVVEEVIEGHVWGTDPKSSILGQFCRVCLLMRRRDLRNQPCRGPQKFRW